MSEALDLSSEILRYEPNNKVVREYQVYLREYIAQGAFKYLIKLCSELDCVRARCRRRRK